MGGILLILAGVIWWWKFLQPPANAVLQVFLGVYLAYAWYSAGQVRATRSPWELAAGLTLLVDSVEEWLGLEAAGQNVIGLPQAVVALTGLLYLADRRAPGGGGRVLTGLALLIAGVVWNLATASRWQPGQVDTGFAWILGLAGLAVLYLWWSHRQAGEDGAWQFGIGLALLVAGLAVYAGYYGRLVPLFLIGAGVGELVARRGIQLTETPKSA
jgi:hypothetical protein